MTDPASWGDGYRAGHEQARTEAKAWCQHVRKMTDQCLEADMLPHGIHSSCYYINACPYLVAAPPPSAPEGVSGDSELERLRRWIRDICWDRLHYSNEEIECLMASFIRSAK